MIALLGPILSVYLAIGLFLFVLFNLIFRNEHVYSNIFPKYPIFGFLIAGVIVVLAYAPILAVAGLVYVRENLSE